MIILSHFQARPILHAREDGKTSLITSTDLGLTVVEVKLTTEGILFPDGEQLTWDVLLEIAVNQTCCFSIEQGEAHPIRAESKITGRIYTLMPTEKAPTMLISGIPMHRIKNTNPHQDTAEKIKTISPIRGSVLDTATGLGYTAIEAAKTAQQVTTIELDPAVLEIARQNPWSQALFGNPRIQQIIGDSFEQIERFKEASFSCIIHDPPTLKLAGDLYSGTFYRQAYRVLKQNGRMFHYIADPDSKIGNRLSGGVVKRLREAGFKRIIEKPRAFGVVAYKD